MKRLRFLAWLSSFLLVFTLVASGVHAHHAPNASSDTCVACTLAHAPAADDSAAPKPIAPQVTGEVVDPAPAGTVVAPLDAVPSSRAPPA